MAEAARCSVCNRPMRSSRVKAIEAPGTVVQGAFGLCSAHYRAQRRENGTDRPRVTSDLDKFIKEPRKRHRLPPESLGPRIIVPPAPRVSAEFKKKVHESIGQHTEKIEKRNSRWEKTGKDFYPDNFNSIGLVGSLGGRQHNPTIDELSGAEKRVLLIVCAHFRNRNIRRQYLEILGILPTTRT